MLQPRKKQKADKSAKDPVESQSRHIPILPIDLWNEIFQTGLAGKDLLNLSLVCKQFYEIIMKTPKTMDEIVLKVNGNSNIEEIINFSRNYTNIKFQYNFKIETCIAVLEKFGPTLRILEFDGLTLNQKDLASILKLVRINLRSLTIGCVDISQQPLEEPQETFTLTKLEKLVIYLFYRHTTIKAFLDFLPDTILDFNYSGATDVNGSVFKFLENQKNLKRLRLCLNQHYQLNVIDVSKINFKLEKFEWCSYSYSSTTSTFRTISQFLKSQAENLTFLKLENVTLKELDGALEYIPKLEILDIKCLEEAEDQYERGSNFNCSALKKLIISFGNCDKNVSCLKFLEKLPNVEIVASMWNQNNEFLNAFAASNTNLKKLILYNLNDDHFTLVSFKSLSELIIKYNGEDSIMENTVLAMENLKVLKLGQKIIMQSLIWILVNFKKLKHLEIADGSKLIDALLCKFTQCFKDLRFLKISNMKKPTKKRPNNFAACLSGFTNLKYELSVPKESFRDSSIDNYNDYNDSSDESN